MNQLFRFHYNLLGSPTHCSLIPKGNGLYSIQEKIAIHFRSSLRSLKEYFRRVLYIPIDLYYNDTIVGEFVHTQYPRILARMMSISFQVMLDFYFQISLKLRLFRNSLQAMGTMKIPWKAKAPL